jgi:hypothetical protein
MKTLYLILGQNTLPEGFEYLRKALENKFHKTLQQLADELILNH